MGKTITLPKFYNEALVAYLLKNEKILGKTMEQLMLRIDACLQKRGGDNMQIGAVVFSNEYGLLGKTEQADELLLKITADVSSEK